MKQTNKMVLAALFAALCCIATMVIKLPSATLGYIHLGDGLVLLSGIILGPIYGGLAAGIGSMFSDIFSGYTLWAPGTFIIKAICAILAGLLFRKLNRPKSKHPISYPVLIFSCLVSELFMVVGYFFYGSFLIVISSGHKETFLAAFGASIAGVLFNLLQGLAGIIITCLLIPIFMKVSDIRSSILNEHL